MRRVLTITGRELRTYLLSPLGWMVATGALLLNGISFQVIVDYLNDPRAPGSLAPLSFFFGGTLFFWLVVLFVSAVLTMRLLSEERRSGTIEMLLTAPVSEGQVVLGKFLGAFTFYALLWLPTVAYAVLLDRFTDIDWWVVAASYLGTLGIGALLLSIGTFASSLTRNQVVAAVFALTIMFVFFVPAFLEGLVNDPALKAVVEHVNLYAHMEELGKGIVDTRRLVYYVSTSAYFLFLASRALEAGKGR